MRYTLFGQGEGMCVDRRGIPDAVAHCAYVAVDKTDIVTDASVSALKAGVQVGGALKTAQSVVCDLVVFAHPDKPTDQMRQVYQILWNASPFVRTLAHSGFVVQVPTERPPLAEVREILLAIDEILHAEQRFRVGMAENPFLAEALVAWSRMERVPGARYYRVRQQQLILSPGVARMLEAGGEVDTSWVSQMPIAALGYIPPTQREQLRQLGVHRLQDLADVSDELLFARFGKEAWLWRQALQQVPGGRIQVNYPPLEQRMSWRAPLGEEASIEVVELLMESMAAQLCSELQRVAAGALLVGMRWQTEMAGGSYEYAARTPIYQPFSLLAGLEVGRLQMVGQRIELIDLYVSELRPLESVQAGFVLYEDAFYPLPQVDRASLEDVREVLLHKFPKKLHIGARPTFREQRLNAILGGG
ncbi:hypothetical protein [Alicyclobacillus suci]|uniref:hypothetical protein n=1 Tax=Alicyclobacillus suci TaxID=2816080 RepID=UPI001A90C6C0|nr:hypothetical protein [Alicyclobacillus suci]